jgi:hypothetical protein
MRYKIGSRRAPRDESRQRLNKNPSSCPMGIKKELQASSWQRKLKRAA